MRSFCLAVIGAASAVSVDGAVVLARGTKEGKIVPKLENVASDKKFFGPPFPADYPDDRQPKVGSDLKPEKRAPVYPYINDHAFSDHDYVQDENSDGGEWDAQMAYDNARQKYNKANQLSDAARQRQREEQKEANAAAKKQKDAQAAEDAAEKVEKEAENSKTKADEEVKRLEDLAKKAAEEAKKHEKDIADRTFTKDEIKKEVASSSNDLAAAKDAFKKAQDAFKECQKNYDAAKAELEKAQAEHDALTKKQGDIHSKDKDMPEFKDYTDRLRVARAKVEAADAKRTAAKAEEEAMAAKEDAYDAEWKRQKHHNDDAQSTADQAAKREADALAELNAAKQRLRNIRNPTPAPKSSTVESLVSPLMLLFAACAMLVA